jgi:hypothetical protein
MSKPSKWIRRNTMNIVMVLVAVAIATSSWAIIQVLNHTNTNCQQIEAVKGAIRVVVKDSTKALGAKGTAGYFYYRSHPDELAAAKAAGIAELLVFKPRAC